MKSLTTEGFAEKIFNYEENEEWQFEGELPCIIDFYADWCGPCKRVDPILEELAEKHESELDIYRIDIEDERELAALFNVQSIPSMLFVPLDDKPQMAVGALPKMKLEEAIQDLLKVE